MSAKDQPASDLPRLAQYFRAMAKADASDLHLKPGLAPHVRIRSQIRPSLGTPLSDEDIAAMARELMTDEQAESLEVDGSIDLAYELPDSDRFRINIYMQRGKVAVAVRRVTREIPDFQSLHLPPVVQTITDAHQGLVLLSGPSGCGKSTTIASMLEHINRTRACHILTLEDPIEYLHESRKALVSQREIGIDLPDFQTGLRFLAREDPDVVLIGEMRDRETFEAALQVAETGHLVFGTLHASGAAQTIGRLMDLLPVESRERIRQLLGFNLNAIICQRLLPSIAEGVDRVPAVEVLMVNAHVRKLICEGRDADVGDAIGSYEQEGMQTFNKSLCELIENELVDPRVAYEASPNPDELRMTLKGITASRAGLRS